MLNMMIKHALFISHNINIMINDTKEMLLYTTDMNIWKKKIEI